MNGNGRWLKALGAGLASGLGFVLLVLMASWLSRTLLGSLV